MKKLNEMTCATCCRASRYDPERWGRTWRELFDTHELVHNDRETRKIEVSEEGDGALAVVDIDTLWRSAEGSESHWKGRVCKVYSRVQGEWKMTKDTGVVVYPQGAASPAP